MYRYILYGLFCVLLQMAVHAADDDNKIEELMLKRDQLVKNVSAIYKNVDPGNDPKIYAQKLTDLLTTIGKLSAFAQCDMIDDHQQIFKIASDGVGMQQVIVALIESDRKKALKYDLDQKHSFKNIRNRRRSL